MIKITRNNTLKQIALALILFLFSQTVLTIILHQLTWDYFNSLSWLRWDSNHYMKIAVTGYEFFPCAGHFGYPLDATEMCGNTCWFPGYPYLIKLFSLILYKPLFIASMLSKAFCFLSLFMVLKISNVTQFTLRNLLFLSIPTFSFGFIYYSAIFPMSAVVFFVLSAFYFFFKRKVWLTGLFCFLASLFYPTGLLLSVAFAIYILIREPGTLKQKVTKMLIISGLGGLGFAFVFINFQITVGDWTAFMQVQEKYHHALINPIENVGSYLLNVPLIEQFSINNFLNYQSVTIIFGYLLITFFFFYKRMFKNDLYLLTYLYISLYFIVPWSDGGDLSRYRTESLLLPFIFLLIETKTKYLALISILLLIIGIPMSYLFFTYVLT